MILDLRSESYLALDPTASCFWDQLLTPLTREERLRHLQARFRVEAERLATDLDTFTRKCVDDGLLQPGHERVEPMVTAAPPVARAPVRRLLAGRAWWCLMRISRALKAGGFASTYQGIQKAGAFAEVASEAPDEVLRRAVAAFARAENFCYLKKAPQDCLPRSLALFQFLNRVGLRAVHCIGVRQFPFGAHAWVEFHGQVVHDNPAVAQTYTVIARLPYEPVPGQT